MLKDLTTKILEKILKHLQEKENIEKIQNVIVEPVIKYTYNRIYPYFICIILIFFMTFIITLIILIILIRRK